VFRPSKLPDKSPHSATSPPDNAWVGDFPSHLVTVPSRPRFGRVRAGTVGVFALVLCLMLAGGSPSPAM